jgi:hypothetical protein
MLIGSDVMNERNRIPQGEENELPDLEHGLLPGVDLDLGSDSDVSGGDDLSSIDEENLYGNDVIIREIEDE